MKKNVLLVAAASIIVALSFTSCGKNSKAYKDLKQQYDSVQTSYQNQISEMDSIIGLVISNFQEINAMEGMINVNNLNGDMAKDRRARIEDNVKMINERLRTNKKEIEQLNEKLKASGNQFVHLKKTVAALQLQLADKTKEVLRLSEELKRKDVAIVILDSMVTSLNNDVKKHEEMVAEQAKTIENQDAAINTVRYCIGTKNDLKEVGIIQNGKIVGDITQNNYLTAVDKRNFSSVELKSKRAELLTTHPEGSYEFVKGADKDLTLKIVDADKFWSLSKVLVIRVY